MEYTKTKKDEQEGTVTLANKNGTWSRKSFHTESKELTFSYKID